MMQSKTDGQSSFMGGPLVLMEGKHHHVIHYGLMVYLSDMCLYS